MLEFELRNTTEDKGFVNLRLNIFKKVIESVSEIVDQMEIKATSKGLAIQVMDTMHVSLADIFFTADTFSSYRCDRDTQLGIPLKYFLTILRNLSTEDSSILRFSCEDDPHTLKIEHIMEESNYEFEVALCKIGSDNYTVPELDYEGQIRMPCSQFRSISKSIGSFGDYIKFVCDKNCFSFKQTADTVNNRMCLEANGSSVFIDSSQPIEAEIAMKYISIINKVSSLSEEISICMGNSQPLFFNIKLNSLGYVRFYVAPKLD